MIYFLKIFQEMCIKFDNLTIKIILSFIVLCHSVMGHSEDIYNFAKVISDDQIDLRFDSDLTLKLESSYAGPSYLLGDFIEGQIDDRITVKNNAQFRKLGMSLKADKLSYNLVESEIEAEGNVTLFREGELYTGPKLFLKPSTMQGYFDEVSYDFTKINGRGKAERVDFVQPSEVVLKNATFTTCSIERPAWELRSSSILVDDIRSVAETKNTSLFWNNSELIPLGDISFSIAGKRKTGLLAPTFSVNSKLGLDLTMPYYFNIAPNRDLTLYPRIVGRRGVQLGADLRFLNQNQMSELGLQLLPSDKITGEDRWLTKLNFNYYLSSTKSFGFNTLRVSDNDYFADFGASVLAASQRILPASLQLNGIYDGWSYKAVFQSYQVLQDPGAPILPPYEWSPKFGISKEKSINLGFYNFDFHSSAEATHFTHPSMAEGTRFVGKSKISTPFQLGGIKLQPTASFHYTSYKKSKNGNRDLTKKRFGLDESLLGVYANNVGLNTGSYNRLIPSVSLEASSILERETRFKKNLFLHTIEPKVFYAFTPFVDQSNFPVFDTSSVTSSLAQLLSETSFFW
jgi:LPS-assembly protein